MKILAEFLATEGIDCDEESVATGPQPRKSDTSVVEMMAEIVEQTSDNDDSENDVNDSQSGAGLPLPSNLTNNWREQFAEIDKAYQVHMGLAGYDGGVVDEGAHPMLTGKVSTFNSEGEFSDCAHFPAGEASVLRAPLEVPSLLARRDDSEDDIMASKIDDSAKSKYIPPENIRELESERIGVHIGPNSAKPEFNESMGTQTKLVSSNRFGELQRNELNDYGDSEQGGGTTEKSVASRNSHGIRSKGSEQGGSTERSSRSASSLEGRVSVVVDPDMCGELPLLTRAPREPAANSKSPEQKSPRNSRPCVKSLSSEMRDVIDENGEGDEDFETLIAAAKCALASPVVTSSSSFDRPPSPPSTSTLVGEGKIANDEDVGDDYSIAFLSSNAEPTKNLDREVKSANAFANFFRRHARTAGNEDDFPTRAVDPLYDDRSIASDSVYTAGLSVSLRKSLRRVMSLSDFELREIEQNMDASSHSLGNSDSLGTSRGHMEYYDDEGDDFSMDSEADEILEVQPGAAKSPTNSPTPNKEIHFLPNVAKETIQEPPEVIPPVSSPVRRTDDDLWMDASMASGSVYTNEKARFKEIPYGAEDFDDRSLKDDDSTPFNRYHDTKSEQFIVFPMLGLATPICDAGTNHKQLDKLSERDDEHDDDNFDYSIEDLTSEGSEEDEKAILREMDAMKRQQLMPVPRKPLLLRYKKSSKFVKISILFAVCFTLFIFIGLVGIAVTASKGQENPATSQSQDGVENPSPKDPPQPLTPSPTARSSHEAGGPPATNGSEGRTTAPSAAPTHVKVPIEITSYPTIPQQPSVNGAIAPTSIPTLSVTTKPSQSPSANPSQSPSAATSQSPSAATSQSPSVATTTQPTQTPTLQPSISSQPTEPWILKVEPFIPPTKSPVARTRPKRKCLDNSKASFLVRGKRRDCEWLSKTIAVRLRMCQPSELPYSLCPKTCQSCGKDR